MAVLEGQVALITGAGSGMGRSTAELFAQEGARVVVVDIDEAGGEQTVATIRAAGGEASRSCGERMATMRRWHCGCLRCCGGSGSMCARGSCGSSRSAPTAGN